MQSLALDPPIPLVGSAVRIELEAVGNAGVELVLYPARAPAEAKSLGRTDKDGILLWTPTRTMKGEIRGTIAGVEYVTRIQVLEGHGLWSFALPWSVVTLCVLALSLGLHKRRRARVGE